MTPQAPSLLAVAAAASGKEVTTQFLSKHDLELIEINKKKSATVGILEVSQILLKFCQDREY